MLMNNKIELQIDGKTYFLSCDIGAMIGVEKQSKKHFMQTLVDAEKGLLEPVAILLSNCLKDEKGKKVGMTFVESIDNHLLAELTEPLLEVVLAALPVAVENGEVAVKKKEKRVQIIR